MNDSTLAAVLSTVLVYGGLLLSDRLPSARGADIRDGARLDDIWRDGPYAYLAISDHSPSLRVAHGLDPKRLRRQLAERSRGEEGVGA